MHPTGAPVDEFLALGGFLGWGLALGGFLG